MTVSTELPVFANAAEAVAFLAAQRETIRTVQAAVKAAKAAEKSQAAQARNDHDSELFSLPLQDVVAHLVEAVPAVLSATGKRVGHDYFSMNITLDGKPYVVGVSIKDVELSKVASAA